MHALARTLALPWLLSACWDLDRSSVETERYPWQPDPGVPEGWSAERIPSGLFCPDGEEAPMFAVTPDEVDPRLHDDAPEVPVAIIYTSGAFDYLIDPPPGDALSAQSWRMFQGGPRRLTVTWAADRGFETLGILSNSDPVERHAGTLPGALAAKGIASLVIPNCWGDLWHNRAGDVDNLFRFDGFLRDGRTMAEFAWQLLTGPFPPTNPTALPVRPDPQRLYMVGLGSGSRAIAELLRLEDRAGTPRVRPSAVVLDSPEDDLSGYYARTDDTRVAGVRIGLDRIHPGGEEELTDGAFASLPDTRIPPRVGVIRSSVDTTVLARANDNLDARLDDLEESGVVEVWRWASGSPAHVLSNADVTIAKAVADFLGDGLESVDLRFRDGG